MIRENSMRDSLKKSLAKTVSWRICASLTTFTLAYLFTHKLDLSAGLAATEVVVKMAAYFFHERMWNAVGNRNNRASCE